MTADTFKNNETATKTDRQTSELSKSYSWNDKVQFIECVHFYNISWMFWCSSAVWKGIWQFSRTWQYENLNDFETTGDRDVLKIFLCFKGNRKNLISVKKWKGYIKWRKCYYHAM